MIRRGQTAGQASHRFLFRRVSTLTFHRPACGTQPLARGHRAGRRGGAGRGNRDPRHVTPSTAKSRWDLNRVHALTGPVYVVGAAPADPSIVPRNAGIAAETMRQAPGRRPYFPVATLLWAGRKCSYRGRKMQLSHFRSACLGPIILSAGPREAPKPRSRPPSIGFSPPGQTGWPGGPAWTALFIGGKNLKNPGGGARSRHRYNDSRWSRT